MDEPNLAFRPDLAPSCVFQTEDGLPVQHRAEMSLRHPDLLGDVFIRQTGIVSFQARHSRA